MSEPNPPSFPPEPPAPSSTFELYHPVEWYVARPRRRYWLHALLFLMTIFTTLVVGARLQYNFHANLPAFSLDDSLFPLHWIRTDPSRLLLGVPFSATLMTILLCHELGHFLYCLRYRVFATLPFFIPAPTLIGTLGAFIRIKSPIRTRSALFDIGIAGPIAGFVVGIAALAISLCLSKPMPAGVPPSDIQFGYPAIFYLVQKLLIAVHVPAEVTHFRLSAMYMHPTAIAAWVGMFATALNLLPGGQLDGGHIVYALKPRAHRWISFLTIVLLIYLARFWVGWAVWSMLLLITGMRHPNVPREPGLGARRYVLAAFGLLMFLLTFIPSPFPGTGLGALR